MLVTYDSSSDDEESTTRSNAEPPKDILGIQQKITEGNGLDVTAGSGLTTSPTSGPDGPQAIDGNREEYEEDSSPPLPLSEREVIRYLTQPTYPMEEMPQSPKMSPDSFATARIKHFLHLKAQGKHFNDDLASKSAFRNPSLFRGLCERSRLDMNSIYATSLPPSVFNVTSLPEIGYKDALLRSQQAIRAGQNTERTMLSAQGKRVIEFTSGGRSEALSETGSPSGLLKKRHKP